MNDTETYALLWSKTQYAFHVEPLEFTVKKGMQFFLSNMSNDYLLIGMGTREDVDAIARTHRPRLMAMLKGTLDL